MIKITSMRLIAYAGEAKSKYITAINKAKESQYEEAEKLCLEGDSSFSLAHKVHQKLLTRTANGEELDMDLLLIHAEDQLMSTELFRTLSREFIDLYKRI
ncbi:MULTISPECIES: PTS lactose/cellobiose transporter subunit IIA [unclassified Gemella]|uniref:PTS lactose/cellobiose transporter subunit IIA n=1 Tax=unclassified Gemella TaxID=2624949 RepID=UPI0015D02B51|nr:MULTISPECIES: PTS lactose/cellobiose transporter subunit IIA [unclassified Gemella]MBF0709945.1 PTS lactose/cellobiose transporter subunit IIA [Gemella sp. GL1.1]MBF0746751.1 PTS lactose/cellobiose transporter subunit IIA [Gemella sp. 19428wG2_WT2a]NYS27289.1 PTS lactose/cellobiose transporter subunit IIA [Gemella sp. GL1]